jgi:hypothetical protein
MAWANDIGKVLLKHYQTTLSKITQALAKTPISKDHFMSAKQTALQWGKPPSNWANRPPMGQTALQWGKRNSVKN